MTRPRHDPPPLPDVPTPMPVAPLDAHLGFWLRLLSNQVSLRFQRLLEADGVTVTDWVALRTLFARTDTTHTDLSISLGLTKGATSKVVSRLEARGLVQRRLADGSTREQLLLTPDGTALVPRLAALADANDEHFFAHLAPGDRTSLLAALQALAAHHQITELPIR